MKKKIFILFVIIVFSFSIGLYMNFVFPKEEKTDDGSIILIGTIENITNNIVIFVGLYLTIKWKPNISFSRQSFQKLFS